MVLRILLILLKNKIKINFKIETIIAKIGEHAEISVLALKILEYRIKEY